MRRFQAQRGRAVVLLFALAFAVPVFSSTIVSIAGNEEATETGDASDWIAEGWTQAGSYTDVAVKATLSQLVIGTPHGEGFAFLEQQVGNHAVQLDSTTFTFPDNNSQVTLFSNLSLGPGTYYLALYGEGFWIAELEESNPTITSAPDVSNVTDTLSSVNNGHTFQDSNNGIYLDFRVTGTAAAINGAPEPRTTGLLFGASILLGLAARSRLLGRRS